MQVTESPEPATRNLQLPVFNLQLPLPILLTHIDLLKLFANLIAGILVMPLVVSYHVASRLVTSERIFPGFSQLASLWPGMIGAYLRRAFYRCVFPSCSGDCWISFGTVFSHCSANVGRRTYVGVGCMLGDVTLEDDVLHAAGLRMDAGEVSQFGDEA